MDMLRFTTAGSVDDGKSTLIGRLLYDSKAIFEDQLAALEASAEARGEEGPNLAHLTDGLRAEREQGITIDVAYRYFATPRRKFIIADTPGHEQYTRNMITGASTADLALILVDARNGVTTQSRRHGFIASLLGLPHLVVVVNKMDLVGWSEEVFEGIVREYKRFGEALGIHDVAYIPASALLGDNIVDRSGNMPWYQGDTVLTRLETVEIGGDRNLVDFRFPVQATIRPDQDYRGYAGTIASGRIRRGEEVVVLPAGLESRIRSILVAGRPVEEAREGMAAAIELEDELDVSRGDLIARPGNQPRCGVEFEAMVCWMDAESRLAAGKVYELRMAAKATSARVEAIAYRIDVNTMHRHEASALELNEIGKVLIRTSERVPWDEYAKNRTTGGFVLLDRERNGTVAAGMIRGEPSRRGPGGGEGAPSLAERVARNGHAPLAVWMTGHSGSGKTTIARLAERALFDRGHLVARVDGDELRDGLCAGLGFDRASRAENVRRAAHAARILHDAGHVVLCSLISPYAADREAARALFPAGHFLEVHVRCPLEECAHRDPKGLYARVARGEIPAFTGVSDPYEVPGSPDLVLDTAALGPEAATALLIDAVLNALTEASKKL